MSTAAGSERLSFAVCCFAIFAATACPPAHAAPGATLRAAEIAMNATRSGTIGPRHSITADKAATEQALAAADAEIEAIAVMAHFVWTLDRFSRFMDGYTKMYPERAQLGRDLSARWRNDQEEALDVYTKLLLQLATGPARDAVSERVAAIRQDMDNRGQGHLKGYLPVLLRHFLELQSGVTPSRDQMRTDILSVPNAAGR